MTHSHKDCFYNAIASQALQKKYTNKSKSIFKFKDDFVLKKTKTRTKKKKKFEEELK